MSLSVDDVVTVIVQTSPAAPQARGFNTALILGSSTILPLSGRTRTYTSLTGVAVDFATNTAEYAAAAAWFGQKPRPSTLKIGRRFLAAQAGQLAGATVSATPLGSFTAITNGGFDITINGVNRQIFAVDLSGAASLAAVAALLQTKLAAALASTTCTYDGTKFIITSPTTGTASIVLYAVAPTGGSSPVDISTLVGFSAGSGAQSYNGIAIEVLTDSLNASALFDPNFYGLALAAPSTQDVKDAMAWAETGVYLLGYTVTDPSAKLAATTTDLFSYANGLGYEDSFGVWSSSPYAAVSALARLLIVNLNNPKSAITLKFKQMPGIAVDVLTETERLALEGKNANYYTSFAAPGTDSGFAMFAQGKCADGTFIDQVFNLAFMQANLQAAYFGALATALTKIEQTDQGVQELVQALDKVMDIGVAAGILAPGQYLGDDIGEVKSGDFLPTGYYTYANPVASQTQGDRDARIAPPITIIGTGAGAIHSGSVVFNFQP